MTNTNALSIKIREQLYFCGSSPGWIGGVSVKGILDGNAHCTCLIFWEFW